MFAGNKRKHQKEEWIATFANAKKSKIVEADQKKTEPQKNKKADNINEEKSFTCKECFEGFLSRNNPSKVTSTRICRLNSSSIQRHKSTWHNSPQTAKCTFLPTNSVDIINIKKKHKKNTSEQENIAPETTREQQHLSENEQSEKQDSSDKQECVKKQHSEKEVQSTILIYKKNPEGEEDSSKNEQSCLLEKMNELTIEVKNMKKHHENICNIAFQDPKKSSLLEALRKCGNLIDFLKVSKDFEWFCDEKTEEGILRCKSCFHMYLKNNPKSSSLNARQIRMVVKGNKFSTGMAYDKSKTRNLIQGGNDTWVHLKSLMINHLCLIGDGSNYHRDAASYFEKKP